MVTAVGRWNYTAVMNIVFPAFALLVVLRFLRTGGPVMLQMMNVHQEDHNQSVHHRGHAM